jgi:GNAT superfamily N-acetyltransferase
MKQFLLATANALARRDIRNGDLKKFVTLYIAGRRKWYLVRDDIARLAMESRRRATLEIRLAVPSDLPSLYALERRYSSTYSSGLASGHFLFLALVEGVPIAFRHLGTSAPPRVADFLRLRANQIYVHDIYTCPEWRRRGVTRELMIESNRHLLSLGYQELFSLQELDNRDSIATMQANGLRRVGILTRTCVLGHITFSFDSSYVEPTSTSIT